MQLKAKGKDSVLVIAFLKGTYCMMQRSNIDTKIRNLHIELHNNHGKERNKDKPIDLNFLINWFNFKRLRTDESSSVLESEKCFNKTAFSGVLH